MSFIKFLILLLFALLLVASVIAFVSNAKLDQTNKQVVQALWQESNGTASATYRPEQLKALPPPVQRYLQKAIPEGLTIAQRITLKQHGIFKLNDNLSQWLPFEATAHITTTPPGMLWQARLSVAPPLRIRISSYYLNGRGAKSGTLLGAIPVIVSPASPELNRAEQMTWLAEAMWYPTALLPGNGVGWTAIDERSARATVDDGYSSATLVFHFNSRDEVTRVTSDGRPRLVNGSYQSTPWSVHYRDYTRMIGMLIPREGEAVWHLLQGDVPYMRARINRLELDPQL